MTMELSRPNRKNLSHQVLEAIERWIMEQGLGPGDMLPTEAKISEELQVSKSSVREAIKMLEALGIVEIRRGLCTVISADPQQGFLNVMISQLYMNSGTAEELKDFRQTMEIAFICRAIQAATEEDLQELAAAKENFSKKTEAGTATADDDIAFHECILKGMHNSYLHSLGSALNKLFRGTIERSIQKQPQVAVQDHEAIYDAMIRRDSVAAIAAVQKSAEEWGASFRITVDQEGNIGC